MNRRRTIRAGVLASGRFLSALTGLAVLAVLSRLFTREEYATYLQTMLVFTFAAPFLTLGLPKTLYYHLPGERTRSRAILIENLLLLAIAGGVFWAFLSFGGAGLLAWRFHNPALSRTLSILAPFALFALPAVTVEPCLIARDRVDQVAAYTILSRLFKLCIVSGACLVWRTPEAVTAAVVIWAAIVLMPALALMFRFCKEGGWTPGVSGMFMQLRYGAPLGLAMIFGVVSLTLDKVLVAGMCSEAEFAIYANGAVQIPFIGIITGSVTSVLLPEFRRLHEEKRHGELVALMGRAMIKCGLILIPMMFFLVFMAPEVMRVLFSAKYVDSAAPFRIWLLYLPLRIIVFGAISAVVGNNVHVLVCSIGHLLLNYLISVFLIGRIGYIGAAVGSVLAGYLFMLPFYMVVFARTFGVSARDVFPWKKIATLLLASGLPGLLLYCIPWLKFPNDLAALTIFGFLYVLLTAVLFHYCHLIDIGRIGEMARREFSAFWSGRRSDPPDNAAERPCA